MSKKLDLTGKTFGKLKVLGECKEVKTYQSSHWYCECQCMYKTVIVVRGLLLTYGRVTKCPKCVHSRNEFYKEDGHMVCVTENGKRILFDEEDYPLLLLRNWNTTGRYALAKIDDVQVLLHRLVAGVGENEQVDHINGDCYDNRKSNLRTCTNQQNQFNRKKTFGQSKYKGVCRTTRNNTNPWKATIKIDGKTKHVGCFKTEEEAAHAYDQKAKELFGEFASPNFTDA